jgi:hypothetical protein
VRKAYLFHVPIVLKSVSLNLLEPSRPVQACNGIALPLLLPLRGENSKKKYFKLRQNNRSFNPGDYLMYATYTSTEKFRTFLSSIFMDLSCYKQRYLFKCEELMLNTYKL